MNFLSGIPCIHPIELMIIFLHIMKDQMGWHINGPLVKAMDLITHIGVTIMKKRIGKIVVLLSMLGLLASCAQTQIRPPEAQQARNIHARGAADGARTHADHSHLARQYEKMAGELLAKTEERKKLLQHYEEKSYLYGRRAQDMQSHAWALLHQYEKATKETVKQAAFHRKMASELAGSDYARQVD